jgi:DNA mismatch repair protein MutL
VIQLRIQQLSAAVANQIAAGEVIERPASVVKELLENALDAGADTISIDIGFGGLNQVKISDNGAGIVAADLPLAIAAHATSKITQFNDLYAITSMGFRGEALASIAAISRLSLSSKPATQEHAMMLRVDGCAAPSISPCARAQGTTVDVQDLFFNAPVRKRFLKTARSEYLAIEMVVKRFALSAPTLALTLRHNGKQIIELTAATCEKTRLQRIRKLLGKSFIDNAIYFDVERAGMRLFGWVSGSEYQRSQNDKQWVYVNQRMMKDKLISHAIKQAYDDLLHPGRYPACLLYLIIPAPEVDVNVHPTKHEVRFQQPRLVHDFITTTISDALTQGKPDTLFKTTPVAQDLGRSMDVREVYMKQHVNAIERLDESLPTRWVALNPHFGIVFLEEQPYLVDILHAQQQRLLSSVNQQTYPLASRPLLVPVRYTINKTNCKLVEQYRPLLNLLGIQLDWLSDTEVIVRTIPLLFSQLDIKKLLHHLNVNGVTPTQAHVLKLVVECQSLEGCQLNIEDRALLVDYLHQCVRTSSSGISWCLRLDVEKCRELFGVSVDV